MGIRGQRCFEEADKLGGLVAKMRLASMAQITSTEAATLNDSAELLAKLDGALGRIRAEFAAAPPNPRPAPAASPPPVVRSAHEASELPRKCMTTVADLIAQRSLFAGDLEATVRRITEAASSTLDIERVSVWFLDPERTKIVCADEHIGPARHWSSDEETFAYVLSSLVALTLEQRAIVHPSLTPPSPA